MNTKMLRKNPPVEGIPSTLEEAKKQRMGLILDAVNREPARLRVVEHERLDPLDPEHGTWRIAFEGGSGGAFRAEITVSQVDKEMHEPDGTKVSRPARSSGFLSSLKAGDELSGWVLPEMHHFPTTLGRDVPLIVVVTGSGISGLMSLLRGGYTGGPLWLICGVRSWKHKSLYGAELEAYRKEGTIARLDAATSRPVEGEGPKRRVQRLLWDERKDVASWLKDGAALYLSGRLSMGRDVRGELGRILVDQGMAANADKAEETLKEWEQNLRLQASVSGV